MRKLLTLVFLMVTLMLASSAFAAPAADNLTAKFVVDQEKYTLNDVTKKMDAKTFIANGRIYVPVRYLGYALGMTGEQIGYENSTAALTLNDTQVSVKLNSKNLTTNGKVTKMDVEPILKNGRTYLPARWVAEAFGYSVSWDQAGKVVTISNGDVEAVEPPVETPEGTQNIGGFIVPKNPTVVLDLPGSNSNIGFTIRITNNNYSDQLKETEQILSSKYDSSTVSEAMTYIKNKKGIDDVLERKIWKIGNESLVISGNWNSPTVFISVIK